MVGEVTQETGRSTEESKAIGAGRNLGITLPGPANVQHARRTSNLSFACFSAEPREMLRKPTAINGFCA